MEIPLIEFNKPGIYCIRNTVNGKVYVGSSLNIRQRLSRHNSFLKYKKHTNSHLQASYDKHGDSKFEFIVLEIVDNIENLANREQFYIDFYKSFDNKFGYNKVIDAVRGTLSKESLEKISIKSRGRKHSEESIKRMSEAKKGKKWNEKMKETMKTSIRKGEDHPFYGKSHTQETKNKISQKIKGRKLSDEQKNKISKSQIGKRRNYLPIAKISLEGEILERFEMPIDAGIAYGNIDKIRYALKNGTTAYGFKWVYGSSNLTEDFKKKDRGWSDESKQKLSQSLTGIKFTEERKLKISTALKGYKHSVETRKNISAALAGKQKNKRAVIKLSLSGEILQRYETIKELEAEKIYINTPLKSGEPKYGFLWIYAFSKLKI